MAAGNRLMSRFDRSTCSFVYEQALRRGVRVVLRLEFAGSESTLLKRAITRVNVARTGYSDCHALFKHT